VIFGEWIAACSKATGHNSADNLKRVHPVLGIHHDIGDYLVRLQTELGRADLSKIRRLADLIYEAWQSGQNVFIFGNGGSGAAASHLCEDLNKSALRDEDLRDESMRRLRVMSLTDNTSWITATGNDLGFDQIFIQQLMHFGKTGDVAVAISGSGNSRNVLVAVEWANRHGLTTFGLTGYDGGKLKDVQQDGIHIELADMGMVESLHLAIGHWVVDDLHARVNRVGRYAA
jgi:D-sedoheptulose 7-phosphate isomerase